MPEALVISKSNSFLILNAVDLYTINEKFHIIQILRMLNVCCFLYRILHIFTAWLYLQAEIKIYFV